MKKTKLALGVSVAAMVVGSLAPAAGADTNGVPDQVNISGSDTTYEMMVELGDLYNRALGCPVVTTSPAAPSLTGNCVNPDGTPFTAYTPEMRLANADHDVMVNLFPLGSGNGQRQLLANTTAGTAPSNSQRVDIARSSSPRASTTDPNLRFVAYAREALTWAAFRNQGLPSNLTQAQLVNIYTGCNVDASGNPVASTPGWIQNWKDVGGPDRPIVLYAAQNGSGTRGTFDGFLGVSGATTNTSGSAKCIPAANKDGQGSDERLIFENNPAPIIAQANQAGAMFYYSGGRFKENRERRMYLGSINGVAPSLNNVANGSFVFSRDVFNVFRNSFTANNASGAALDFAGIPDTTGAPSWLCRNDGQSGSDPILERKWSQLIRFVIRSHGFAPISSGATGGNVSGAAGTSVCRVS